MEYRKPRMDARQREARRIEAVRRLKAGESAAVVAADLGLAPNTVYMLGKRRRVGQFFRLYEQDIDGERCAEFLRALLKRVRGKVVLIWDGLAVHRSPPVKAVLARSPRVTVHRLPSYAPELNPVEPMWGHAKGVGLRGFVPEDLDDLEIETECVLEDIAERQGLLRSFFKTTPLAVPGITS